MSTQVDHAEHVFYASKVICLSTFTLKHGKVQLPWTYSESLNQHWVFSWTAASVDDAEMMSVGCQSQGSYLGGERRVYHINIVVYLSV